MTPDTLNEMILGFSVILGILLLYAISIFIRFRREKRKNKPGK
jgi:hypothetical protein